MPTRRRLIAVCGESDPQTSLAELAFSVGKGIAERGAVLICGGLTGVMEHAARGARAGGGTTVGLLPGDDAGDANPYIDIPIATGLGHGRNAVIAFPTYQAALDCWKSPEYQRAIKLRQPVSTADLIIIEGYEGPQPG